MSRAHDSNDARLLLEMLDLVEGATRLADSFRSEKSGR
ncbi:hypothetical protein Ae717Ps2_6482 [Pseudonocardia sp. Ae717_Ps2]|nr:hypothetical protein Ae717Ps2_6482 [Pseudonocardia sp. Ae717_Ps2]